MASILVRNERLKLAATFLNTIAGGSVVVGVVAPLVAVWDNPGAPGVAALVGRAVAFVAAGLVVHFVGQLLLGGLRDDKG